MIITETRKRRGKLYLLVLDGEPAMTVDARTFDESPFRVGSVITDDQLRELLDQAARRRTREKALYLLSMRDHSRAELEEKLRREGDREAAAETAERMEELGLVNDEAYAYRLAEELRRRKLYPLRRTEQELTARGVDRELARRAAEDLDIKDADLALELLRKKYYNRLQTEEDRRKTQAALARRGFGGGDIRRAMDAFREEMGGWADNGGMEPEIGEITEAWP